MLGGVGGGCCYCKVTTYPLVSSRRTLNGFSCRADSLYANGENLTNNNNTKKKVVVVGSGWAGLGAAHHLSKQGFDVTLLEDENLPGSKKTSVSSADFGIHGLLKILGTGLHWITDVWYPGDEQIYVSFSLEQSEQSQQPEESPEDFGYKLALGYNVWYPGDTSRFMAAIQNTLLGFWYPYRNIFSLVDELGLKPFTKWTKSALYSPDGLEVVFPVYQDQPQLPTPLGALFYTQHLRLPLVDRLTSLPLMTAVIDFDNTDIAWRKYDSMTARELFKQFGCSDKLYQTVFSPLLQVGLFAPAEQCSAAAALGMLYYFILAHQRDFDAVWCRGTVRENIFEPWLGTIESNGCKFVKGKTVTDFSFNEESGSISEVVCGEERYGADAVIMAVGISTLQQIILRSSALKTSEEFLKVLNLSGVNVVTVRMRLDRKVNIPNPSNVCFGLDDLGGWSFFDLSAIYDEYHNDAGTVIEANFYHKSQFLGLDDEQIVAKVMSYLSRSIELHDAIVLEKWIRIYPKALTHFFPGSYKYMMRGSTTFPNLFMAGDWIINRHGSWLQEKAYVTGLEAANRVVAYVGEGRFAKIIPVEEDEPHVQSLRSFNRSINEIRNQLPLSDYFL